MSNKYEISLWRDYLANDQINLNNIDAGDGIKAITSGSKLVKGKVYYIWKNKKWNYPYTYVKRKKKEEKKTNLNSNDYIYYFMNAKGETVDIDSFSFISDSKTKYRVAINNQIMKEEKICLLASSTMDKNKGKISNIHFIRNIDGTKTLTFDIPGIYNDITGKVIHNELLELIHLKSKLKLLYDGNWYTFVVNTKEEKKTPKGIIYSVSADDLAIEELSKNGFSLNFTDDVETIELSGVGTAKELAERVLEGTDWKYSDDYSNADFRETNTESVYDALQGKYIDKKYPVITYAKHYSPYLEKFVTRANFDYNDKPVYYTTETETYSEGTAQNLIATNSEFTTYPDWSPATILSNRRLINEEGISTYNLVVSGGDKKLITISLNKKSLKAGYYVLRINTTNRVGYIPKIKKGDKTYCSTKTVRYTNRYYILNLEEAVSNADLVLDFKKSKVEIENIELFALQITNKDTGAPVEVSSTTLGVTPPAAKTIVRAYIRKTDFIICEDKDLNKETIYKINTPQSIASATSFGKKKFFTEPDSDTIVPINDAERLAEVKYLSKTTINNMLNNIIKDKKDIETYTDIIDDFNYDNFQVNLDTLYPPKEYEDSIIRIINSYNEVDYYQVEKIEYNGEEFFHWANVAYKTSNEKIRIFSRNKSNRYTLLQDIAEKFEVFVGYKVLHNPITGEIIYNGTTPQKLVYFTDKLGETKYSGFKENINLENISRKTISNEVVTKMYVEYKESDTNEDGLIDIGMSLANPTGEKYILNFNHYLNTGVLDKSFPNELSNYKKELKKYNDKLKVLNEKFIKLKDTYSNDQAAYDTINYETGALEDEKEKLESEIFFKNGRYFLDNVKNRETLYGYVLYNEEKGDSRKQGEIHWFKKGTITSKKFGTLSELKKGNNTKKWYPLCISKNIFPEQKVKLSENNNAAKKGAAQVRKSSGYDFYGTNTLVRKKVYTSDDFKNKEETKTFNCILIVKEFVYKENGKNKNGIIIVEKDSITPSNNVYKDIITNSAYVKNPKKLKDGYYTGELKQAGFHWCYNKTLQKYCNYYIENGDKNKKIKIDVINGPYFIPNTTEADFESKIKTKGKDNGKIQRCINPAMQFSTFKSKKEAYLLILSNLKKAQNKLKKLEKIIEKDKKEIDELTEKIQVLLNGKKNYIASFENKYCNYIKEGYWSSSDSYIDHDSYYYDALIASNNSSIPKVEYTLSVLDLSSLFGFEEYAFEVGDETFIVDRDIFGFDSNGTPVRERVAITNIDVSLDNPKDNKITIKNYTNRFEDLFSRISASMTSVETNKEIWSKADAINSNGTINSNLLSTIKTNNSEIVSAGLGVINNYTLDAEGLHITNSANSNYQMRLTSMGLAFTSTGNSNTEWTVGMNSLGINAEAIQVGNLKTNKVSILSDYTAAFVIDSLGATAYDSKGTTEREVINFKKFVRMDKYGLYLVNNSNKFDSDSDGVPWYYSRNDYDALDLIHRNSKVSITRDGFRYNSKPGNSQNFIRIGAISDISNEEGIWFKHNSKTVFKISSKGTGQLCGFKFNSSKLWKSSEENGVYNHNNATLDNAYRGTRINDTNYPLYIGPDGIGMAGIKIDAKRGNITIGIKDEKLIKSKKEEPRLTIYNGIINGDVKIKKAMLGPFFVFSGTDGKANNEYIYTKFSGNDAIDLINNTDKRPFKEGSSALLNRSNKFYLGEFNLSREILVKAKYNDSILNSGVFKNLNSSKNGILLSVGDVFWVHSSGYGFCSKNFYFNGTLYAKNVDTENLSIKGESITGKNIADKVAKYIEKDGEFGYKIINNYYKETKIVMSKMPKMTASWNSTTIKFNGQPCIIFEHNNNITYLTVTSGLLVKGVAEITVVKKNIGGKYYAYPLLQ